MPLPTRSPARLQVLALAAAVAVPLAVPAGANAAHRPHPQPDPGLQAAVDGILADPLARDATIGLRVQDATTGETLVDHQGTQPLVPASNGKLRTSAAAMDVLGPEYRFRTDLLAGGPVRGGVLRGDLVVKGYGDPTLREADMESLAAQLRSAGVTRVSGGLGVDTTFFDDERYHPDWDPGYESDYYAGQISALTMSADADLDNGTFVVEYAPGAAPGDPATVTATPAVANGYVELDNRITTGAPGSPADVTIVREHGTNHVVLTGTVPAGGATGKEWVTVDDPGLYAAVVLRAALARAGITVDGPTRHATAPRRARLVGRDTSVPLREILVPWLKLSNNPISEDVLKTMAAHRYGRPGSWADGTRVVRDWMTRNRLPLKGVVVADGSGLARTNRLTAESTTALLRRVQSRPWFSAWYGALPVAGDATRIVGGTLRNRMKGTAAAGNVHAKTGTLTGVTSLSGYVTGADGRPYVFSMMSNYPGDDDSPRPLEDRIGVLLAGWSRPGGYTPTGPRPARSSHLVATR